MIGQAVFESGFNLSSRFVTKFVNRLAIGRRLVATQPSPLQCGTDAMALTGDC